VAADGAAAIGVVRALRERVRGVDPGALVGGPTAVDLDTRTTARADLVIIIPAVLIVITLMLMMLLRSVLAPVLLIATTALSYLSTLGISSLVFDRILGFPGADPVVPLFGFVFLVALGIDYNIFLTSRIREEALQHGTRPAVLIGLRSTGGVITSAGIVLAATFAALAVIPLLFLVQLAFIVAFGVLLDALVVRSFLVPGLLYDLGKRSWWPSALSRSDGAASRGDAAARALAAPAARSSTPR
jgi:putative drug exporter of the RND superfamily